MHRVVSPPKPLLALRRLARRVALLLALCVPAPDSGQAALTLPRPLPRPLPRLVERRWRTEDGLPHNTVWAVRQTRDGYLWVGTQGGLARFDGVAFTAIPELTGAVVTALYEDHDGSLWIGTDGRGLYQYRDRRCTAAGVARGLASATVWAVLRDRAGVLWVGTGAGLFRTRADGRFAPVAVPDDLNGAVVTALADDGVRGLWAATFGHGLMRLRGDSVRRITMADGLSSDHVRTFALDAAGAVWAAAWGAGIDRIGPDGVVTADAGGRDLDANPIRSVYLDHAGVLWVASMNGLVRLVDGRLVSAALPGVRVDAITEDREGNLWAGLYNGGLVRFTADAFRTVSSRDGLRSDNVRTVLEDPDGTRWIGTKFGGLYRLRAGRVTVFTTVDGLLSNSVWSLYRDAAGTLWVGTAYGINRLDDAQRGRPHFTGFPSPLLATAIVQAIAGDSGRALWIGTEGTGLLQFDAGRYRPVAEPHLATSAVRAFHTAPDGSVWIATEDQGLFRYWNGHFTQFTTRDGLGSDRMRGLYQDDAGVLWVGSDGGGLARFAGGRFTSYGVADGLADNQVWNVQGDALGRLWMSSDRGLFVVDTAALNAVAAGRARSVHSAWYGRAVEFNGSSQPSSARASDGTLLFASMEGLVIVDPASTAAAQSRPPLHVEAVTAGDARWSAAGGAVRLPANRRTFQIAYAALALRSPDQVRFRYQLDGLDAGWEDAGARRTAYYTRVPPGRYTFRVVASSTTGAWAPVEASLPITVTPYFYETWWFATACGLGVVVLAGAGYQARIRQLRRREAELTREVHARTADVVREKDRAETALTETEAARATIAAQAGRLAALDAAKSRLFANLSHEFRTPLTLIVGPIEELQGGRHGELAAGVRAQLALMGRNGERLLRLINRILDLSKLEHGSLVLDTRVHDLTVFVRDLVAACAPLAEQRGIALRFHGAAPCVAAFDAERLEQVVLNLLANALKFTPAGGSVDVVVERAGDKVSLVVRDTGAGIAPDELPRVFDRFYQATPTDHASAEAHAPAHGGTGIGLALAKELVALHGGTIGVESAPGLGTCFTVRLPASMAAVTDQPRPADASMASGTDPGAVGIDARAIEDVTRAVAGEVGVAPEPRPAVASFRDRTTVLVVDDNADLRTYVRSVLEPAYRVLEAGDGAAGLAQARAALPDLIVADVMMPGLDGLALGRALKDDPATDSIPLVLLTARAAVGDEVAGLRTGADDYVTKPFAAPALRARVDGLIASRRRLRDRFRADPAAAAAGAEPASTEPATPPQSPFERQLRAILATHLADGDFNPDALAAAAGLTYRQLYQQIHDGLDTTPSRFIRTVRVEHAARLLAEGAGSVTEVAYAVGFNSLSYFNRAFRERFGAAPSGSLRSGA